jgi:hypothetical protein
MKTPKEPIAVNSDPDAIQLRRKEVLQDFDNFDNYKNQVKEK